MSGKIAAEAQKKKSNQSSFGENADAADGQCVCLQSWALVAKKKILYKETYFLHLLLN